MAKSELEIIITAKDQTSGVIGKLGGTLSKTLGGVGKVAGAALMGGIGIAAGVATAGIAALGAGLKTAIGEAMEAQEIEAQLNAVIESTGGVAGVTAEKAMELADSLSGVTRFSDDAILSGENMLLTFTNIGKDIFPQATETILDMSQALGQDLQSSAIQLGKALNDPISGVTALQRVGVKFTDSQKEMIEKLVESGDVMGAQKLILQELKTEFGNSARAAGQTFGGQLDILKNKLLNIGEDVGKAILPILTEFITKLAPKVIAFVDKIGKAVKKLADVVKGGGIKALFSVFEDGSSFIGGFLKDVLGIPEKIAYGIGNKIAFLGKAILKAFEGVFSGNLGMVKEAFLGLINDLFGPQASGFVNNILTAFGKVWSFITQKLIPAGRSLWTSLTEAFSQIGQSIATNILPAFSNLWNAVTKAFSGAKLPAIDFKDIIQKVADFIANTLIPKIGELIDWLSVNLPPAIETAVSFWNTVLKPALEGIANFVRDTLIPKLTELTNWLSVNIGPAINTAVTWFNQTLLPALKDIANWIKDHIVPAANDFLTFLTNIATGEDPFPALTESFKKLGEAIGLTGENADTLNLLLGDLKKIFEDLKILFGDINPKLQGQLDILKLITLPLTLFVQGWRIQLGLFRLMLTPLKQIIGSLAILKVWLDKIKTTLSGMTLPDWLVPGSPTPLELGLLGINKAMKQLASSSLPTLQASLNLGAMPSLAPASISAAPGAMGGGAVVVNVSYSPGMSLGNRSEFESQFIPLIDSAVRKINRGKVR